MHAVPSGTSDEREHLEGEREPRERFRDEIYICASCDGVAGYYPRRYEVIPCPHCDGDAYHGGWFRR